MTVHIATINSAVGEIARHIDNLQVVQLFSENALKQVDVLASKNLAS